MTYRKIINICSMLFIMSLMTSCSRSAELQKIDELRELLSTADEMLAIDMSLFQARKTVMEKNWTLLRQNMKEVSLEFGMQMDKYKNIKKIYAKQIKAYTKAMKEKGELKVQLDNLEKDVSALKMSKDDFKLHYRTEKDDIVNMLSEAKEIKKALYEVEPEYVRLEDVVAKELMALEKQ